MSTTVCCGPRNWGGVGSGGPGGCQLPHPSPPSTVAGTPCLQDPARIQNLSCPELAPGGALVCSREHQCPYVRVFGVAALMVPTARIAPENMTAIRVAVNGSGLTSVDSILKSVQAYSTSIQIHCLEIHASDRNSTIEHVTSSSSTDIGRALRRSFSTSNTVVGSSDLTTFQTTSS